MKNGKSAKNGIAKACREITRKHESDVVIYNGTTFRDNADKFIRNVSARNRRKNVLLVLVTPGGMADAAYRVARCLQQSYERFTVLVPGWCKSAGTLCVLGAHEVVMTEFAELGPLDVQIAKKDELGESSSGLVLSESMRKLREHAFFMFEEFMLQIKEGGQGSISFKMATDIAANMAVGLSEPLFRQVDPIQIGENARSIAIARAYGERLQIESRNSDDRALDLLIESYPDHGFVIDRREAERIFRKVRAPTAAEKTLLEALGDGVRYPSKTFETMYLNDEQEDRANEATARSGQRRKRGANATRGRSKQNNRGDSAQSAAAARTHPESAKKERIRLVPKSGQEQR